MAADPSGRKGLLANPAIAAMVTDLAIKAGTYVVRRGTDRLFGVPALPAPPRKKGRKAMLIAAPVAVVVGTGALAGFLYRRSEARRKRLSNR